MWVKVILGGISTALQVGFKFFMVHLLRKGVRDEGRADAAEQEVEDYKEREKTDEAVRKLSDSALADELYRRKPKPRKRGMRVGKGA